MSETGKTLRELRRKAKLSLREFAPTVGFSAAFLCDVEVGHRRFPLARLHRLPDAMREPIRAALKADVIADAEAALAELDEVS